MADFLGKLGANDGIAEAIGQQAGKAVEGVVKKVMSGNAQQGQQGGQEGEQKKEGGGGGGGGFDVGDVLSFGGGSKKENDGGFDVGDVLKLGGGNKDEGQSGGGGGLGNVVGGFFK